MVATTIPAIADAMRAVVFDWDLTLWDSWGIHLRLMDNTAAELGIPAPSVEAVAAEFHRPFRQHLLWFFGSRPDAENELDAIIKSYLSQYEGLLGFRNYLFPGVMSLLESLRRRGILIGILSDKYAKFGRAELRRSGLDGMVDFADFKTDARPYKPAPEGLHAVLAGLGVSPEDAMYVGDGPQDIACARSVGAVSAAALWSAIDGDATLAQGPTYRLYRPHQALAALAAAEGADGSEPWVRGLPWPWRGDEFDPQEDQDAPPTRKTSAYSEPAPAQSRQWPMAAQWNGRTDQLSQPPADANPVAPLSLRTQGSWLSRGRPQS